MSHLGLHLFLGPDRARKLQRIQEIGRTLGVTLLDRHYLHPAAMSSAELIALCRQRPAASAARLIVIDEAQRLTSDCVNALLHHAQVIAQNACAILLIEANLGVHHPLAPYLRGTGLASFQRSTQHPSSGGVTIERFPMRDAPNTKPFALVEALGVIRRIIEPWSCGRRFPPSEVRPYYVFWSLHLLTSSSPPALESPAMEQP